jgi:hypothetical protein
MVRLCIGTLALAALLSPGRFTFTIGAPVAAMDGRTKLAAFVFRTEGCADAAKAQVDATAEGLVQRARQSVVLKLTALSTPGVYAVQPTWPRDGDWVVSLRGTCAGVSAGALVPIVPGGFDRASSQFFARPATEPEVAAALHTLSEGRKK